MIARDGGRPTTAVRARSKWDRPRRTAQAFLATAVVGGILWYIGVFRFDLATSLVLALAVGSVISLLTWVMSEAGPRLSAAYWFASMREEAVRPAALDYRMLRLRRDLRDATERTDREDLIFDTIRAIAAERLAAHHDIDLDTQPEVAAQVMHRDLTHYLSHPPTGTGKRSKRDIDRALDRIEEL